MPPESKTYTAKEAMSMNRKDCRKLAQFNGIKKIPSIIHMPVTKPPVNIIQTKKSDKYFNSLFKK